jgi:hypothetical protein
MRLALDPFPSATFRRITLSIFEEELCWQIVRQMMQSTMNSPPVQNFFRDFFPNSALASLNLSSVKNNVLFVCLFIFPDH